VKDGGKKRGKGEEFIQLFEGSTSWVSMIFWLAILKLEEREVKLDL
jgi:hypothetical protein